MEAEIVSKSFSQARLMALAKNDPVARKRLGIPLKVAKEFVAADEASGFLKSAMRAKAKKKMAEGGAVRGVGIAQRGFGKGKIT